MADGENTVAHGDIVAVADGNGAEVIGVDLQDRNVAVLLKARDRGIV